MDIPAIVKELPLEDREDIKSALRVIKGSGLFESIQKTMKEEMIAAAMVLAHNREHGIEVERVAIQSATIAGIIADFITIANE